MLLPLKPIAMKEQLSILGRLLRARLTAPQNSVFTIPHPIFSQREKIYMPDFEVRSVYYINQRTSSVAIACIVV